MSPKIVFLFLHSAFCGDHFMVKLFEVMAIDGCQQIQGGFLLPLPHPREREKVFPSGSLKKARKFLSHKPVTNVVSNLICPVEVKNSFLKEIVLTEVGYHQCDELSEWSTLSRDSWKGV